MCRIEPFPKHKPSTAQPIPMENTHQTNEDQENEGALKSLRFEIPAQAEESLRAKLRKFADNRCAEPLGAFAKCSKNKTFTVITKCREEHSAFIACVNQYVNEPNLNRLRHAYQRGELMKDRSYEQWKDELAKRKHHATEEGGGGGTSSSIK